MSWISVSLGGPTNTYSPKKKLETVLVQWEKSRSGSSISQFCSSSVLWTPGPLRLHPSPQLPSQALEGSSAANAAVKDKTMDDKLYDVIQMCIYIHTLHYITLQYNTLHYIALHCITLHYITLHWQWHNITLHYIALHCITYTRTYIYIYTWVLVYKSSDGQRYISAVN